MSRRAQGQEQAHAGTLGVGEEHTVSEGHHSQQDGRDETTMERADRNWNELLQELRVTQTGVAILFSMLLTVPFSARFTEALDGFGRRTYLVALLLAAASVALLVGPVAYHRVLFAQGEKTSVVRASHLLAVAGLTTLWLALTAVVLLIVDILWERGDALLLAGGFGVLTGLVWFVPALLRRRSSS
jgi:hypothetical protein